MREYLFNVTFTRADEDHKVEYEIGRAVFAAGHAAAEMSLRDEYEGHAQFRLVNLAFWVVQ